MDFGPQFDDKGLIQLARRLADPASWDPVTTEWAGALVRTIQTVRDADAQTRASREFQEFLWEKNRVSAPGMGNISVKAALDDMQFRQWLAERSFSLLPATPSERIVFLTAFFNQIRDRLKDLVPGRSPSLKIYRVLAALYPNAMTTVAHADKVLELAGRIGIDRSEGPFAAHVRIREWVNSALELRDDSPETLTRQMVVPWRMFKHFSDATTESNEVAAGPEGILKLRPIPVAQRLRSLYAIPQGFDGILAALDFIGSGVTPQDFREYMRDLMPDVKDATLDSIAYALQRQFGVIKREGDRYVRTERGESLLSSRDPSGLGDWLLTHVLGIDSVIVTVRDNGPQTPAELIKVLRAVNPALTANYVPGVMLRWLKLLGVLEPGPGGTLTLSDIGREWGKSIDWVPEPLPKSSASIDAPFEPERAAEIAEDGNDGSALTPPADIEDVVSYIRGQPNHDVPPKQICQLHASLWGDSRRHFAILTGLSGSGKTWLAHKYALAIAPSHDKRHLLILPVQPGWYDPSALLGYVNPVRPDKYSRTDFLEFLLSASRDPGNPYTVVLDEFNLSRPEQFMAPLLSAMETGEDLRLHQEGESLDGVPSRIPYPNNLAIIGTVNMDETTHGLSDKILDRAFVMEFWDVDLGRYAWNAQGLAPERISRVQDLLERLNQALAPARMHFGWRVVDEFFNYLRLIDRMSAHVQFEEALDDVVYSKILPKLRGEDNKRFQTALESCLGVVKDFGLERSIRKVEDLRGDLSTTGNARFWR